MSRIKTVFDSLKSQQRQALIPYITAGDPAPSVTVGLMHKLVKAGADIIELGMPFSDPMADGPTIQLAHERSLAHKTSVNDVLAMVKEFRQANHSTPVVLMGYLNPIEWRGYERFAKEAKDAGVDGVLLVDLPPEEAHQVEPLFKAQGIDMIYLIAPTTTNERIAMIGRVSSGYVYYVSLKGVTGSKALDVGDVEANLKRIRQHLNLPVGVGFGISNGETAAAIAKVADGVIVGSALINQLAAHLDDFEQGQDLAATLLHSMREAMDA
ncbi:MAG: tryptophan synthase subunit alpha [Venatoribacter sp.]